MYLFILFLFLYALLFIYKTKTGSPYLPSSDEDMRTCLAYLKPGDRLADLGAGDGRLLIAALQKNVAQAWGWEIEPFIWLKGYWRLRSLPPSQRLKIRLIFGDMYQADLSHFNVIFVYQLTRFNQKIARKIRSQAQPGTLIIANKYPLPLPLKEKRGHFFIYQI